MKTLLLLILGTLLFWAPAMLLGAGLLAVGVIAYWQIIKVVVGLLVLAWVLTKICSWLMPEPKVCKGYKHDLDYGSKR